VSHRRTRGGACPPPDEVSAEVFFGEPQRSRRGEWKTLQLSKQVERAAVVALAACEDEVLAGACVAGVEPAPDAARLRLRVVLAPGRRPEDVAPAREALRRASARFREEAARSIHRKRVPELVFDVWLMEEVSHE
jgi:hypothetical protein